MTVIAVANMEHATALACDAIVPTAKAVRSARDCRLTDKITTVQVGSVYACFLGDEFVRFGLHEVLGWLTERDGIIDLASSQLMDDALHAATLVRQVTARAGHHRLLPPSGATIYGITRSSAFYWDISYDAGGQRYVKDSTVPVSVPEGSVVIDYGGERSSVGLGATSNVAAEMIAIIEQEHQRRPRPRRLPYDFEGRYSSVLLPKNVQERVQIGSPFRTLSDKIAGDQAFWDLIDRPSFSWSPQIVKG